MRQRLAFTAVWAVVFILIVGLLLSRRISRSSCSYFIRPPTTTRAERTGRLNIILTETGGSHDEVVAALMHSFGSLPNTFIDLYQTLPRFNMSEIMGSFKLSNALPEPKWPDDFKNHGIKNFRPDVFVAATCELDLVKFKDELPLLLADRKTYIFCIIHHADRWGPKMEQLVHPWVDAGMLEFWTLSPHTEQYFRQHALSQWAPTCIPPLVRYFVPLFPVALPPISENDEELSFAVQGDFSGDRRDYATIFHRLVTFMNNSDRTSTKHDIVMHLLGHGDRPQVPSEISSYVKFDENLAYPIYYGIISRTFALLPAFASNEYLDRKASSSVPAALIGGTPLVVSQAIFDAYSYITPDTVWLQSPTESDFDVVERVLNMSPKERCQKKEKVRQRCAELIRQNTLNVEAWINLAWAKIQQN
jgi:hypothetical protein